MGDLDIKSTTKDNTLLDRLTALIPLVSHFSGARIDNNSITGVRDSIHSVRNGEREREIILQTSYNITRWVATVVEGRYVAWKNYSVCRNDPGITEVHIYELTHISDEELSQALLQNEHVKRISLDMEDEMGNGWDSLLRVIATHGNLEDCTLKQHCRAEHRSPHDITKRYSKIQPFRL